MAPEKHYFQIDYKGAVTTSTGEFREGYTQGTILVEANSVDDASIDSAAEEIALTTAQHLTRQNLAELGITSQRVARRGTCRLSSRT
jgi:hypothetical protein